jgi:hypothetical protein|tara:strand:+ start:208 stop:576 length:369 start_codon:yes stop_codon:yes gene_type:complete
MTERNDDLFGIASRLLSGETTLGNVASIRIERPKKGDGAWLRIRIQPDVNYPCVAYDIGLHGCTDEASPTRERNDITVLIDEDVQAVIPSKREWDDAWAVEKLAREALDTGFDQTAEETNDD